MGFSLFCERFINYLATIKTPLHEFTNNGIPWKWTNNHQQAFDKVKEEIAKDYTTVFYDSTKRTQVTIDARPLGLEAILSQFDGQVMSESLHTLAVVSVKLNDDTHKLRKRLLVLFLVVRNFTYTLIIGIDFELDTDHKPLEAIYHPKAKVSARIK